MYQRVLRMRTEMIGRRNKPDMNFNRDRARLLAGTRRVYGFLARDLSTNFNQ